MQRQLASVSSEYNKSPLPFRCFGREKELNQILSSYELAKDRQSAFVLVTGRSGIGKSTLLIEAQKQLRDIGALVLEAKCRPGLSSYRPFLDVARGAFEQLCTSGKTNLMDSMAQDLLDILSGRFNARQSTTDPATNRLQLFDQIATLLTKVSLVRPTVLVIHDLDLADPSTSELARYLGRVLTAHPAFTHGRFRGLLIANARSLTSVTEDPNWADGINLNHIELTGLSLDGIRAFLSSEEVIQHVLNATQGAPNLLEQWINQPFEAPESIWASHKLNSSEKKILHILAVFGRSLSRETLHLLAQLPYEILTQAITKLTHLHILEKEIQDGEIKIGFAKVGDQQTLYEELNDTERREFHAQIGNYLQTIGDSELEACAEHLLRGECGGKAVRISLAAGERLENTCCFERAAGLYEKALLQTDTSASRIELLNRLCNIYEFTGELNRALEHAKELRQHKPGNQEIALRIGQIQLMRGDILLARTELNLIYQQAVHDGSNLEFSARVLASLAESQFLLGEIEEALNSTKNGLFLCESAAAEELQQYLPIKFNLQDTLVKIHLSREEYDLAQCLLLKNLDTARFICHKPQRIREELRILIQLGLTNMNIDQYAQAEEYYFQARELAQSVGEWRFFGICNQHLGVLAERKCAYSLALEYYQEAVSACKKVSRHALAWVGLDLSQLYVKLGDIERATALLTLSKKLVSAQTAAHFNINLELLHGLIDVHRGYQLKAIERFQRAYEQASDAQQIERKVRCLIELGYVYLQNGDYHAVLHLLHDEIGHPRQLHLQVKALLLQGSVELAMGEHNSAQLHFEEALRLSENIPDPESAWKAKYHMALIAHQQGRLIVSKRLLAEAARDEECVRLAAPEAFRNSMAEQPIRIQLHNTLANDCQVVSPHYKTASAIALENKRGNGISTRRCMGAIIGAHYKMQQLYDYIEKVAAADATVLINGESGTGKELIADAIHSLSQRKDKPLVKVNCGALVESLLLSELFGHERGAFTGALQRKKGRFELADGGTIFLDEIGDISPKTQVALLRVLQEREFERVGGVTPIRVNVRIICATNRNLEQMVTRGEFREDLYYRLNGIRLEVPSLRERIDDLPLLADHILNHIVSEQDVMPKQLSENARIFLSQYSWPGNVRELENVLRSVSLLADSEILDIADFQSYPDLRPKLQLVENIQNNICHQENSTNDSMPSAYNQVRNLGWSLKEFKKWVEVDCITEALNEAGGNITRAAELLGMKRPRLSQLIKEHGISANVA